MSRISSSNFSFFADSAQARDEGESEGEGPRNPPHPRSHLPSTTQRTQRPDYVSPLRKIRDNGMPCLGYIVIIISTLLTIPSPIPVTQSHITPLPSPSPSLDPTHSPTSTPHSTTHLAALAAIQATFTRLLAQETAAESCEAGGWGCKLVFVF